MSYPSFEAAARTEAELGSRSAQRLRAAGKVPVAVATNGGASKHLTVSETVAETLRSHRSQVVLLQVDGSDEQVLVKEVSIHPIKDNIMHIDTVAVTDDRQVNVSVRVRPINTSASPGIKAGGLLEQGLRRIDIRCAAKDIPAQLTVDLDGVELEQTVYANTIALPEGARLLTQPRAALLTVIKTRGMRRAEAVKEEE